MGRIVYRLGLIGYLYLVGKGLGSSVRLLLAASIRQQQIAPTATILARLTNIHTSTTPNSELVYTFSIAKVF